MFSKSPAVHAAFEDTQNHKDWQFVLKRLNTTRRSSSELCLDVFLDRYSSILETFNAIEADTTFNSKIRADASGSIQTKQFMATAYLFHEKFAQTGQLNRYLQSVHLDISKVIAIPVPKLL